MPYASRTNGRTWRALVLGGGGATGEFQIGALQVIADRFEMFDMYIGVGAGALNSSVLAQFPTVRDGYKLLIDAWDSIKGTKDIFDIPFLGTAAAALGALVSDQGFARDSIYGNGKLRSFVQKYIAWDSLSDKSNWAIEVTSISDGQLYTVTNNSPLLLADANPNRRVTLSLNPVDTHYIGNVFSDFVTAAGSVPLMLPPVDVFGLKFVEGGLRDFTPLELAVKAFAIAKPQGYDRAEFIVVDNYTEEVAFDGPELLDSGLEIAMRAIKIMSVEMAQNDIFHGRSRLAAIGGADSDVLMIHPAIDYRLNPMDFDNTTLRQTLRNHGVTRATLLIPHSAAEEPRRIDIGSLYTAFLKEPDNTAYADEIVALAITHPSESEQTRNRIKTPAHLPTRAKAQTPAVEPANLSELISIMTDARSRGLHIKAQGAGYAFSDVLQTTGPTVSLARYLNGIWNLDGSILKDPTSATSFIEFEAGATIDELNTFLSAEGRALLNQPGYERLSFVGVASCGGHGSGIRIGPIADSLCAITLLTFDAQGQVIQKRVEPTVGITDPAKFRALYPNIDLVQDDQHFRACKVAVGCVGIIYSVVIKTQPAFFLEERRTLETWDTLQLLLPGILHDDDIHSIHIWFNPYPIKGHINCVLSEYRVVAGPAKGHRGFGTTFGLVPKLVPLLLWFMEILPAAVPALINSSLKATVNPEPVVMPCTEALNFGTPNQVHVDATNCGVPVEMVKNVADRLFEFAEQRRESDAYITCPFGFRFAAASDAFLAPQYRRASCMIEMPLIFPTPHAKETIDAFLQLLISEFGGRPHWGQEFNQNVTSVNLEKLYPDLHSFRAVFDELNDGTFDNEFTQLIGLSGAKRRI